MSAPLGTSSSVLDAVKHTGLSDSSIAVDLREKVGKIVLLDPRRILPMPNNPRLKDNPGFTDESISLLADSILTLGQQCLIKVYPIEDPNYDVRLIDGERRYRACLMAGVMIRAEILEESSSEMTYLLSVASNFGGEGHTSLEIANIVTEFKNQGLSVEEIASIFSRSAPWVYQYLNVLKLSPKVQELLVVPSDTYGNFSDGVNRRGKTVLSFSLVINLCDLPHPDQEKLAFAIVNEGMSLTQAKRSILVHREKANMPKKRRRPKERFNSLRNLVSATTDKFGVYQDMQTSVLKEILSRQDPSSLSGLKQELESLMFDVSCIKNVIEGVDGSKK